jgi:outer membrane immunogenic protein
MRLALFVALAGIASASTAYAADMPMKAPMKATAQYDWTGCYVGGNVGGIWGRSRVFESNGLHTENDTSSIAGGAHLGCNYMTESRWVVSIEGDWSRMNLDKASLTGAGTETYRTDWKSSYSVRGRIGYAPDNTLWYITGGPAWAHQIAAQFVHTATPNTELLSATHTGWMIGAGIEHALTRNWTVGVEYLHARYGEHTYTCSNCGAVDVDHRTNEVRARISYKFGP